MATQAFLIVRSILYGFTCPRFSDHDFEKFKTEAKKSLMSKINLESLFFSNIFCGYSYYFFSSRMCPFSLDSVIFPRYSS